MLADCFCIAKSSLCYDYYVHESWLEMKTKEYETNWAKMRLRTIGNTAISDHTVQRFHACSAVAYECNTRPVYLLTTVYYQYI